MNDIIDELMDLHMEPKPELLWLTSAYKVEDELALRVGSRRTTLDLPFDEAFDLLAYHFRRNGKGMWVTEKTLERYGKLVAGWVQLPCEERVSQEDIRQGGQSRLQHCFEWECTLPVEYGTNDESETMGIQDLVTDIQTTTESWRRLVGMEEATSGEINYR